MKNEIRNCSVFIIYIIFSFLSPVFSADHDWQSLGVKFGMRKKEIVKYDRGSKMRDDNKAVENRNVVYLGYKSDVYYLCDGIVPYFNDKLFKILYSIETAGNYLGKFSDVQKRLEKKYGKPASKKMLFWMDAKNGIELDELNDAVKEEYYGFFSEWEFKEYSVTHIMHHPAPLLFSHDVQYYASSASKDFINHNRYIMNLGVWRSLFMSGLSWGIDMNKTVKEINKAGPGTYSLNTLKKLKDIITIEYELFSYLFRFVMTIYFYNGKDRPEYFDVLPSFIVPPTSTEKGLCGIKISLDQKTNNDAAYLLAFLYVNHQYFWLNEDEIEKRSVTRRNKILLKEPEELYLNYHKGILKYDYVWKTKYFTLHNTLFKEKSGKNRHELWIFPPD